MRRILVCVVLAACGDNLAPTVDAGVGSLLQFTPCRTPPLECATLTVPVSWADPTGDTMSLAVVRAPARDPANRIGALTFNFGGPGASTLDPIADNYPNQPIGSSIDLTARFDFVLMDWRGVATSTPAMSCLDTTTGPELATETFAPQSDADWTQFFALTAAVDAGCSANTTNAPLLAHEDTESAARDFDALRAGLGEAQLNMWVVSYGTRLGSMYATLFPDRVRALALDSPMPPAPTFEGILQSQSASFELQLGRFFDWCAGTTQVICPFRTADGLSASISTAYEALLTAADTAPLSSHGLTLDRAAINLVSTNLMYFPSYEWSELGKALASLSAGSASTMANLLMNDALETDDNSFSAYENVWLQDMPLPADIATTVQYEAWAQGQGVLAPHTGLQNANLQAFAVGWPTTSPAQPAIGPTTAPPLLITATRNDPATPYAGALALQQAFANNSYLVTYEGDGHANVQFHECLGDDVANFLIDPTTAPATMDCAADVIGAVPAHVTPYRIGRRGRH